MIVLIGNYVYISQINTHKNKNNIKENLIKIISLLIKIF
jgi:hypothetical protein